MITYYARRAAEYERVYGSPRWQDDLEQIRARIRAVFAGRRVFEVACGTGYWTRYAAQRALAVHATDVNDDTLALARAKTFAARVSFERRDAYLPATGPACFDGGLAALWLSHVDLARLDGFVRAFHSHLEPGAVVFMFDERVTGERDQRTPASRTDAAGNRYEMRRLESGAQFEIVKNAFDRASLERAIGPSATGLVYRELRYFWTLDYAVA
ncbi:MAG TPA: class I SAM-dependent methyltransferase [Methylomirabilota bacterium]|jgi:demethylmenaquinone methyltransferase/2-methoxy-6-polyprenyl-1,4-benzoquinol methylase